jgi:tetratricopeptide (TPR) repeat protein
VCVLTVQRQFIKPSGTNDQPTIRWHGKSYTIAEADALAIKEHRAGNLPAVAHIYGLILAQAPNYAEGHNNRGAVLQKLRRYADALACYDRAIALKPHYANAHYNRGSNLKKMNRPEEALASYEQAIALNPNHAEAHNNRGVTLQEMKRYDDALPSYERAIALNPGYTEAYYNLGTLLVSKGDMPAAEKMFLKAVDLKPDFPAPLFNLAKIREYQDVDNSDVKTIKALLNRPGVSLEDKDQLYFTLGKIYDDCGRFDEAFEFFKQGNRIRNRQVAYSADAVTKMTDAIMGVFNKDFLACPFPFSSDSRSPLFIVGMPRSGTTLLASILSNHRSIGTAGELPMLTDVTARLHTLIGGDTEPFPYAIRQLTSSVAGRIIHDYEKRLRRDIAPGVPYVIDKNPINFRNLGLITMLFPKARIIHCTRAPFDTVISNYFQRFPLHLDYAFDLANIAHFYHEYSRLMDHWRTVAAVKFIDVDYEDMVVNTEQTARRMLELLGLEWDARCLKPHTNPFPVETASQWQVRQPIYQHSVERWRHYEKFLAPLKEILAPAAPVGK